MRQEVGRDVVFSRDMLQNKIVILKLLKPSGFMLIQVMGFFIVQKVLMICLHYYLVLDSGKVKLPMCQGFNYSEQFFCVDIPIVLAAVHHLGHECNEMELPLLIALLQYSTNGIGGCISVHNEGMFEIGVMEYRGSHNGVDKGIKSLLTLCGPYRSTHLCAEGD